MQGQPLTLYNELISLSGATSDETFYHPLFCHYLIAAPPLQANDSAASVGAGGVQFHKTPGIVMEKEDLFISPDSVKVLYVFKNLTDRDITVDIFFPLPPQTEITAQPTWDPEILSDMADQEKRNHPDRPVFQVPANTPFDDFSVTVDGQKIAFKAEMRALQKEKDITRLFHKHNLSLSPVLARCDYPTEMHSDQFKCEKRIQRYKKLGLLSPDGTALWQKQTHYHWKQTFPKGKEVKIEHSYRPVRGSFFIDADPEPPPMEVLVDRLLSLGDRLSQFCHWQSAGSAEKFSPWLIRQFQEASTPKKSMKGGLIMFYDVDYILTTGANWEGAIRDFTLTVEYPKGGTVISCWPFGGTQAKDLGNNQLQFHKKDFKPEQDLKILFGAPYVAGDAAL